MNKGVSARKGYYLNMICKLCESEVNYNKSITGVELMGIYPYMSEKHEIQESDIINIHTCYNCAKSILNVDSTSKFIAVSDYEPITFKCEKCNNPKQEYIEEITGAELKEEDINMYNNYDDLIGCAENHMYSVHYCSKCNSYDYVVKRRIKNKVRINKRD